MEVPFLAYLVFEIAAVWFLDPLGQVAEEDERRDGRALEHGDVFDLDELAFVGGRGIGRDDLEHVGVELRGGDDALTVLAYLKGGLEHAEDALLGEGRGKDDGEVSEGREAGAYRLLVVAYGLLALVLDEVPFVDDDDEALLVALYQREDGYVLCLDAACGVDHEDADV